MKKIGKQVLMLETGEENPRNGEGTFIRLKNGVIMHAYTDYYGKEWCDDAIARISACYSSDEGESWSAPSVLIEKAPDDKNIMSPSLFRMPNGEIGIVYLRKSEIAPGQIICMPVFSYSKDEGKSWSSPVLCCDESGYNCAINVDHRGQGWIPCSLLSQHGLSYAQRHKNHEGVF